MNVQVIQSQVNLTRMIGFLEQASNQGASLVVFPECSLQGYALSAAEASAHAEVIPGPAPRRWQQPAAGWICTPWWA